MRIGYLLTDFPVLTETFLRREIESLCRRGHRVFVYTNQCHHDPRVPELAEPNLVVREISFARESQELARVVAADGIEHLHGSLMRAAHQLTLTLAQNLRLPFSITAYSGHDIFTAREPNLYRALSDDALCAAVVVEDEFMRAWLTQRLGAQAEKIVVIPNSFDLELYRRHEPRVAHTPLIILAIARFVEKKGLIHLVNAFNRLTHDDAELWLVGQGPEEARLRQAARDNPRVKFFGAVTEAETRRLYEQADIFCLPCIQTARGDADGVPTTLLEAMAFELPVVSSDLLSIPQYVTNDREGILVPPGDEGALVAALEKLGAGFDKRAEMGRAARARVENLCDERENTWRLENIFLQTRWRLWREKLDALEEQRAHYTAEREKYYTECRVRAVDYFRPRGRLLDIGCDQGQIRVHLPPTTEYFGCDVQPNEKTRGAFPFVVARGEALPFADESFDTALLYAVLIHVLDVDAVLTEAARVLKPGGHLYLQECYDDPNPIHLNHFSAASLRARVGEHLRVVSSQAANEYLMMMIAQKVERRRLMTGTPLVSVCVTAYNREKFIARCIDSVLNQTYRPLEVVVVDDGSTDETPRLLAEYGAAIRVTQHAHNEGRARAKNDALRMSSEQARYVAILDSDDYYAPNFVERAVAFLEAEPEIGLVYADDLLVDDGGRVLARRVALEPWSVEAWLRTRNVRGDTWLARRALVMQTHLHDEHLTLDEDYDLFYQLLELTTFAHLPEFLVYIRHHRDYSLSERLELARCHAANLVKYGYSPEYAYLRARRNPEWIPAIEEGITLGQQLKEQNGR